MNNHGQIFSVDFIISLSLGILFLGLLLGVSEVRMYSIKETKNNDLLINETNAKLVAFVNGKYSCVTDNEIRLPYSIDELKIENEELTKNYLGIDKNMILAIGSNLIINNELNDDIVSLEFEALVCNGEILFADLNNCLEGESCSARKEIVTMRVSKWKDLCFQLKQ